MNYADLLNEQQLKAVSTSSQYTRVIAGAGSGKTRVLTYRIAYLISEMHVDPSNILAIAFTNKVATEMKERVVSLLPEVANFLHISTFHSFGAKFLRNEIQNLGMSPHFTIFDDDDSERLIKDICVSKNYSKKDDIIKESMNYIFSNKEKGFYPDSIKIKGFYHEEECLEIFKIYEERKRSMIALDFNDLLLLPIMILENFPEIREKWRNKLPYILIDEFQDTNNVQFTLVKLLSSLNTSLYVVGDPDQTIYTWRGANQRIILDFEKTYKGAETIILNRNYRSTKTILDTANKLIAYNKDRVKKDLYTNNINGDKISLYKAASKDDEASHVISSIIKLKENKSIESYREVAILYRSSYLTLPFEKELVKRRIQYKIYGGVRFYQRKEIKDALAYFRLIINHSDDVSFERIINVPRRKIGEKSILDLKAEARLEKLSLFDYIEHINPVNSNLAPKVIIALQALINEMNLTKQKLNDDDELYSKILEDFLINIGYYEYIETQDDADERIDNLKTLFSEMVDFIKKNPDEGFEKWLENCTLATSQDELKDNNYVSLMTVHTAKGLEFNYVFVIGLSQGVFPNQRALEESKNGIEEERRLAYVAFTRAKKQLNLSMNNGYSYVLESNSVESQFIKESGLKMPNDSYYSRNNYSFNKSLKIYDDEIFFDEHYRNEFEELPIKKNPTPLIETKTNGITDWKIHDKVIHDKFGEGTVIKIIDKDVIEINFKLHGKKTMLANHPAIKRVDVDLKEMN